MRHGGGGGSADPDEDEEEEATKLQTIAAERLVGLSRTAGADGNKSETESKSDKEE